jgi:hypothetical protein
MQQKRDRSLGDGVFYAREDCRGIRVRLVILIVDIIVLAGLWVGLWYLNVFADLMSVDHYVMSCFLIFWIYMAVLRQSAIRTPGYWLTKSQIVTLKGQRPSILRMTFRIVLWLFGPFNMIYDLAWAGVEMDRQSMRDRVVGTMLIRYGAKPIGTGEIHIDRFFVSGFSLMYPRVMYRKLFQESVLP